MEYIVLKNSTLKVSRLCMGGCPMGGYGWGEVHEQELIKAVQAALDSGVTMFDTADTYGLGQSERTLGKALGKNRRKVVIADKFGVRVENGKTFYDNSPQYIKKAIIASLNNLGTDYIDLYQVHYRDEKIPLADVIGTMEELVTEGKIRFYGLSNISGKDFDEIKPYIGKIVSVQNEYSLACRKNENTLKILSSDYKVSPLTWGSLGQGILSGKYGANSTFGTDDRRNRDVYVNFHGDKLTRNLKIVEKMKTIAEVRNVPLSALAIRFILDWLDNSVVLVGAKRPSQILDNIRSMGWKMSDEELSILEKVSRDGEL